MIVESGYSFASVCRRLFGVFGLLLILAACSASEEEMGASKDDQEVVIDPIPPEIVASKESYDMNCQSCHGGDGKGQVPLFKIAKSYASMHEVTLKTMPYGRPDECDNDCADLITPYLVYLYEKMLNEQNEQPPESVSAVVAQSSRSKDSISLSWSPGNGEESGFRISRSIDNGTFDLLETVPQNTQAYVDNYVELNHRYQYQVVAFNDFGEAEGVKSNAVELSEDLTTPAAPSMLSGMLQNNRVSLDWNDNAANEESFEIYRRNNTDNWSVIYSTQADVTSYVDASVEQGTTYSYRVTAKNAAGESRHSNVVQVTLKATGAALFETTCVGCHKTGGSGVAVDLLDPQVKQSWSSNTYAEFLTKVKTMQADNCDDECFNLVAEYVWKDQWLYTIDAENDPPASVNDVTAVASQAKDKITIRWTDRSNNETGFKVFRAIDDGVYELYKTLSENTVELVDSEISNNHKYQYALTAFNDFGESTQVESNSIEFRVAPQPVEQVNAIASADKDSITITWKDQSDNEDGFTIYRSVDSGNYEKLLNLTADSQSYIDDNVALNHSYQYQIMAYNSFGDAAKVLSNLVELKQENTPPSPPSSLVGAFNINLVSLSWNDNSDNEDTFELYRKTGSGSWSLLISLGANTTQYNDTAIAAGNNYSYKVSSKNSLGESASSNEITITYPAVNPTQVLFENKCMDCHKADGSGVGVNLLDMQIKAKWANAAFPEFHTKVKTMNTSDCDADCTKTLAEYLWNEKWGYELGDGENEIPLAVKSVKAEASQNKDNISLSWTDRSGNETGFNIYRSIDNGSFNLLSTVVANVVQYSDSNISNSHRYQYQVEAYNSVGKAAKVASNVIEFRVAPADVSSVNAVVSADKENVTISWQDNSDNEAGFKIYRSIDSGSYSELTTVQAEVTSYTDTSITLNHTYQYQLMAYNNFGNAAKITSNLVEVKKDEVIPPAPTLLAGVFESNSIILTWQDNATNEDSFEIYRRIGDAAWSRLTSVGANTTTYTDSSITEGTTYSYQVSAKNSIGESAFTNVSEVTYPATSPGESAFNRVCSGCHNSSGGIGGDLFTSQVKTKWSTKTYDEFTSKVASMQVVDCDTDCLDIISQYIWEDAWGFTIDPGETPTLARGVRGLRLLTPYEYQNVVKDIFQVALEDELLPKAIFEDDFKYPTQAERGVLLADRVREFHALAEKVAARTNLTAVGCSANACTQAQLVALGLKVFRRPLTSAETTRYSTINTNHGAADAINAMLLSPHFLYLVELGTWSEEEKAYQLDSYEVASMLSFQLWGTAPDSAMLAKAASNDFIVSEKIGTEIDTMMNDDRFAAHLGKFVSYYTKTYGEPHEKPGLNASVIGAMKQEQQESVKYLFKEGTANINELFNPGYTFLNNVLASHYGINGVASSTVQKTELSDQNRGGLLHQGYTQILNSDFAATSLVKRGKMIRENMLCHEMGVPSGVDPATIELPTHPITTRERWNVITGPAASEGQCWECHQLMNEPGSSLESFDQTGKFRTQEPAYNDASKMLDIVTAGTLRDNSGGTDLLNYQTARELTQFMGSSNLVRDCFADNMFRFVTGHKDDVTSRKGLEQVQKNFRDSGDMKALIKEMLMNNVSIYRLDRE
ncbi:c-type cytochrome [Aliikangiella coralliicola]|uniref:c-type cytochrome n=1 Tax=Aliikangiella coralliicola TaxID=2592383 RepID=UPI00143D7CAC|nr:DUF1592 domain-containing protein [Aliikangiella coralliicola]